MCEATTIAYLEDDSEQGSAVERWLGVQAIQCHVYKNAASMRSALETNFFDAIMLDVEIGGETSGLSMLEHIRSTYGHTTPVLMVSSKSYWHEALSCGADDFLEKPLNAQKLCVHLQRLLRTVDQATTIEDYPPYKLDEHQRLITYMGNSIDLSANEYELASTLFKHFGKVLSYNQLIEKLPNQPFNGSARKVESDLVKLKRKMDLSDLDGWKLEPVYQHGYRLVNAQFDAGMLKTA